MFTFEIKINGAMIAHIYGHDTGKQNDKGETEYEYKYYETNKPNLINRRVYHWREDGMRPLIMRILDDIEEA